VPAIQPALLRKQAVLLAENFENPPAFKRSLHYLLEYYAEHSRLPGQAGKPAPIIAAYKVHPPVLRFILQELESLACEKPDQGLILCDSLWEEPYLEFRLLASMLLGKIPPEPPELINARLNSWLSPDLEFPLIEAVMKYSLIQLRKDQPEAIMRLIKDWLEQKNPFYKQLGLRAILPIIHQPDFENLPIFFRLIQSLMSNVPTGLRPDLLDVLAALAERSPQETAFFMQQCLSLPNSPDTHWLIRQSLKYFPAEIQNSLRQAEKRSDEEKRKL
jgi:DNA alkylation repair enzyme